MTEPIFPTLSRTKHAKTLSYPIGAQALSRALDGVPQHDQIGCTFYAGNPAHEAAKDRSYVLSVTYEKSARTFHHSQDAGERGVFDPRWRINVYAVLSELRHEITAALVTIGLPDLIQPWLIRNAHLTGKTGNAVLWLEYDRVEHRLLVTRKTGIEAERE